MQSILISILGAAAVLGFLWLRAQRIDVDRREPARHRGIIDEAARAYEDVGRPVLRSREEKHNM
ncbi:hypothetical protein ASD39_22050 [Sphingomonas sp. Root50]|nr:hypothetical protein ASD17_18150 [Sphingomonas sp. Root1294]KQY70578.1 hypothetical protein ASD39_22050 [Sphingomonas sp. Root50]